jgi:hypothetical protein
VGLGWMFDAMDVLIVGTVIVAVTRAWRLDASQRVLVHRSGVAHGGHFEGVPAPRLIRRSEFRSDAYVPSAAGCNAPRVDHPTRMQEYRSVSCLRRYVMDDFPSINLLRFSFSSLAR